MNQAISYMAVYLMSPKLFARADQAQMTNQRQVQKKLELRLILDRYLLLGLVGYVLRI